MTQATLPFLSRGDRLPNFGLLDCDGVARSFYLEVSGGPILLFVAPDLTKPDVTAALASYHQARQASSIGDLDLFALAGNAPAAAKTATANMDLTRPCLCDSDGGVLSRLINLEDSKQPTYRCYLLDANQRVLTIFGDEPVADPGRQALDRLAEEPRPDVGEHCLISVAPVLTVPNVFEAAFCQELIEAWSQQHQEGSVSDGTKNVYAPGTKRNLEHVIQDAGLRKRITQRLAKRIGPELVKVFQFNQPYRFEAYTILSYRADRQDFFGRHRDNVRQTRQRRFAISLNLNDDFEGGALYFPEYPPHRYRPPAGGVLLFSGNVLHEAEPVTKGQRWALTTFLIDPDNPPS